MTSSPSPADHLARQIADVMWANDRASKSLGFQLDRIGEGQARMSMTVREEMINGHDTCHGGMIFTLADSAFAFACNSHNQISVAQHCSVTFVTPAFSGDRLTAVAKERQRAGRSGIYDVTVTRQDGSVVAEFRGNSRTIKGTHVPTEDQGQTDAGPHPTARRSRPDRDRFA